MKLFLMLILFALFVLIAIFVYSIYLFRSRLYQDMIYICKSLKNNISFNKNDVGTILRESYQSISKSSKFIIQYRDNQCIKIITRKERIISDFYESLGRADVDYEINNLNYYEERFLQLSDKSHNDLKTNGSMYFKLIIGLGLIVCIILI